MRSYVHIAPKWWIDGLLMKMWANFTRIGTVVLAIPSSAGLT